MLLKLLRPNTQSYNYPIFALKIMNTIPINDISDARLDPYMRLTENQLARINEPAPGVFVAESVKVISRAIEAGYEPVSFLIGESQFNDAEIRSWIEGVKTGDIFVVGDEVIKSMRGFEMTGGVLCCMKRGILPDAAKLCKDMKRIAILEDVENPTNVGAIFRSAAAFDIEAVLLTRDCADPLYRRSARVSMGNVFNIPWTYIDSVLKVRNLGFKIAAMALREDNVCVDDKILKDADKLAIVMGNENNGLQDETLAESDYVVKIPMSHGVDSLNVAAASAVAFWEICHNA